MIHFDYSFLRWIGPKNDSIQYSIQNWIKNIHSIRLFIQIGKKSKLDKTVKNSEKLWKNMQNGAFFTQNALFIHFSYEYRTFLIHIIIHLIVQQKYSFKEFIHSKENQKYSFKEFIHSKNNLIIHSIKIFIFWKNAVSPTPTPGPLQSPHTSPILAQASLQKFFNTSHPLSPWLLPEQELLDLVIVELINY